MDASPIIIQENKDRNKPALELPLLTILGNKWTIGDACEGVQIFGGTGSGKTSGSGQTLAKAYLQNNFGGLVLTVKAGDANMWKKYCKDNARAESLIVVDQSETMRFNFLNYLVNKQYSTVNITHVLMSALQKTTSESNYWENAKEQLIKNTISLLVLANGSLSIQEMYKLVLNAPKTPEESELVFDPTLRTESAKEGLEYFKEIIAKIEAKIEANTSSELEVLNIEELLNDEKEKPVIEKMEIEEGTVKIEKTAEEKKEEAIKLKLQKDRVRDNLLIREYHNLTLDYWKREFPNLDPEPRSSIISMFTALADSLLRGELAGILSSEEPDSFYPEMIFEGSIIVMDLNLKTFKETGKMAQLIFKTIFQMAVERERDNKPNKDTMEPIFLWIDEAQFFLTKDDVMFQTTARSCKVCSVYLTQNYSNYLAFVGSGREKATVDAFLGVLQTKIFHCQSDPVTNNEFTSSLIGKNYKQKHTKNVSDGFLKGSTSNWMMDYKVLPWQFDQLKKGGESNNFKVEAYIYNSGKIWNETKDNYGLVEFDQMINK